MSFKQSPEFMSIQLAHARQLGDKTQQLLDAIRKFAVATNKIKFLKSENQKLREEILSVKSEKKKKSMIAAYCQLIFSQRQILFMCFFENENITMNEFHKLINLHHQYNVIKIYLYIMSKHFHSQSGYHATLCNREQRRLAESLRLFQKTRNTQFKADERSVVNECFTRSLGRCLKQEFDFFQQGIYLANLRIYIQQWRD
ncbi:Hypothetical_protein [Hexamita inflata]|uniref:Hypothetical_protein n=1 Tax=Hexamita inflata TaxID=28002 RepID=A0AA86TWM3_9EUKA|nr:Hypothetical protein HINF_LOCUS11718 [Hexamita inflata]